MVWLYLCKACEDGNHGACELGHPSPPGTYGGYQPEFWKPNEHRRLIYHVPRSALIWHDVIKKFPELEAKYHDAVLHDILAHHGKREFGSPVAPKTRAAYLIHLCDSISARMDDCERIDAVKNPDPQKV